MRYYMPIKVVKRYKIKEMLKESPEARIELWD